MGLEKIDVFKKEQGLTNEELSKLSGVPKATIDKITSGATRDPKLETIKALVYCLGHSLDDLDDKKSAPEPAATDSEATLRRMQLLIDSFEAAGYVRPGEDLTDEQLRFCMALVDFLDTYFGRDT